MSQQSFLYFCGRFPSVASEIGGNYWKAFATLLEINEDVLYLIKMLLLLPIAPHIGSVMRKRFPFSDAIIADHNKTRHVGIFFECAVYSEQTSPNTNRALNLLLNLGVIHSCLTQPNTIGPRNNLCYHYVICDHNGRDCGSNQQPHITLVYSTVYSGADQRKHQSSASLAFVRGIHRWPMNSPHKWPVTRKMFPFDDVIMWL